MASSKIQQVFERGTQAFNDHDIDAMGETMAEDVSLRAPGDLDVKGKAAAKGFYKMWIDAFPDARVEHEPALVLGDVAVEEGVFIGTHRGTLRLPSGDLPATGRAVRVEYVQIIRYRGDRAASFHLVFDRLAMLEQLGLAASPDQAAYAMRSGTAPQPTAPH